MDLVGGYYDAGDHVKFGQPMAFAVTMLSWAAVDFNKDIIAANQMGNTLWAIRWGTDYFLKAHTRPNVLWAQVNIFSEFSNNPIYVNVSMKSYSFARSSIGEMTFKQGAHILIIILVKL